MPTEDEIKPKVIDAFTHKVTLSYDAIEALVNAGTDDMFADLGMGGQPIDSMAISLTQIAKTYAGGVPVLISSVRGLHWIV